MNASIRAGTALLAAALGACLAHRSAGPAYPFRALAAEGVLDRSVEATLGDQPGAAQAFRFELPSSGALLVAANAEDPAVRLEVALYAASDSPLAASAGPKVRLKAAGLRAGIHYAVVREPGEEPRGARFALRATFRPDDPEERNGPYRTAAGARALAADGGLASDWVDYSRMRRTHFWKVTLPSEGTLTVKFRPGAENISAELVAPGGAPAKVDPAVGLARKGLPRGDYYLKVFAEDAGDGGPYEIATAFEKADPCRNAGPECTLEGAEELKLLSDTRSGEVDATQGRQFHNYRAALKEKGRLTITFKPAQPRGAKLAAFFLRGAGAEGEPIAPGTVAKDVDGPGDVFIRVQGADSGEGGSYTLQTLFQPSNFIAADVVEIGRSPCLLTVGAGSNQGVRAGASCTVVNGANGAPQDTCVVDRTFPTLSKVRPASPGCRVARTSKVQITP